MIRSHKLCLSAALMLLTICSMAQTIGTVVVPDSVEVGQQWHYTFSEPGTGWSDTDFDDTGWQVGPGAFGVNDIPSRNARTVWETSDIWIRRTFEISTNLAEPHLKIHHDEDVEVYLNGVLIWTSTGWTDDSKIVPLQGNWQEAVKQGENTLAVHVHQTGGGQYIDVGIIDFPNLPTGSYTEESINLYTNPLDVRMADPQVCYHEGIYYLYATTDSAGFYVWSSRDLVNWQSHGYALAPSESRWGTRWFWAPEVVQKDGTFYMFYSAEREGVGFRICAATSDSPLGPFTEVAAPVFDFGHFRIDAHVFFDTDEKAYLYSVGGDPYGIHVAPLKDNLTELDGPLTHCISPSGGWEGWYVNEGPFVLLREGTYYLMYSANGFEDPNYSVGYATASSPLGPWTKYGGGPILSRTIKTSGPGHHGVTTSPDGSEWFIVYHSHQFVTAPSGHRHLNIDRLAFVEHGSRPDLLMVVNNCTSTPQPYPSGAAAWPVGRDDEFEEEDLDRTRWTVFDEDPNRWELEAGALKITTTASDLYQTAPIAYNNFLQYAPPGDFEATAKVEFTPEEDWEQAYLVIFEDHNNYIRFGLAHEGYEDISAMLEEEEVRTDTFTVPNTWGHEVLLKVTRTGTRYDLAVSRDGQEWHAVKSYDHAFREVKVGFSAQAPGSGAERTASFDFFHIRTPTDGSAWKVW